MVRGLALAETTPGPLIMVVQFVAFLGAYRHPGTLNPWVAGVVAVAADHLGHVRAVLPVHPARRPLRRTAARQQDTLRRADRHHRRRRRRHRQPGLYFAVHTLFADTRRVTTGPFDFEVPLLETVQWSLAITALAFLLIFKLRWSLLRTLGLGALVGAVVGLTIDGS